MMSTSHRSPGPTRVGTTRLKRAAVLFPLALLSAAWTVSISTTGASTATADDEQKLPDGTSVPSKAITIPASVTADSVNSGVTGESAQEIISTASASEIPAAALASYQRAETVINRADPTCRVPWQLIAAIGRVESNHGRAQGNTLDDNGLATPGIFGIALDGSNSTTRIVDTDAGRYDGDTAFDRAVGPMQFIPSTWSTVGVDADGDGVRNPQDINDAALAAAVYLCSGDEDLSLDAGQKAAVLRYNHSASYLTTVLSVYRDYLAGDFSSIPNYVLPATYFEPAPAKPAKQPQTTQAAPAPAPTATQPEDSKPAAAPESDKPVKKPSSLPTLVVPSTGVTPLDQTLTKAQATTECLADYGYNTVNQLLAALTDPANGGQDLPTLDDLNQCVAKLTD